MQVRFATVHEHIFNFVKDMKNNKFELRIFSCLFSEELVPGNKKYLSSRNSTSIVKILTFKKHLDNQCKSDSSRSKCMSKYRGYHELSILL